VGHFRRRSQLLHLENESRQVSPSPSAALQNGLFPGSYYLLFLGLPPKVTVGL
jgi:hypothetical protein